MYVADWGNNRVQVLGPDGRFRIKLLGDAGLSKWVRVFTGEPGLHGSACHREESRDRAFPLGPHGGEVDTAGQLYIVDSCRYRIQIYRRSY